MYQILLRLPIVRDNTLLGIITSSDLARKMYEKNRSDPTLQAMSRFGEVEKLTDAQNIQSGQEVEKLTEAQNIQSGQEQTKSEHNCSSRTDDMREQNNFCRTSPNSKEYWSLMMHHKCQIKL